MIFSGIYKFDKLVTGYKRDYCKNCKSIRTIYRAEYFPVIHIWFIPLIPLFFGIDWTCSTCKKDALKARPWKFRLLALFLFVFGANDAIRVFDKHDNPEMLEISIPLVIIAIGIFRYSFIVAKKLKMISLDVNKSFHTDFRDSHGACWVCNGDILLKPKLHCSKCNLRIYEELDIDMLRNNQDD